MTLLTCKVNSGYALLVSDRLLTASTRVFDERSNKCIVLVGGNGAIALGYSGLAYIHDTPTDQWIVESLVGRRLACPPEPLATAAFEENPGVADIGRALHRLRQDLARDCV